MAWPRPLTSLGSEMGLEPTSPMSRAGLFLSIGAVANLSSFNDCTGWTVESTFPKESGDWNI